MLRGLGKTQIILSPPASPASPASPACPNPSYLMKRTTSTALRK